MAAIVQRIFQSKSHFHTINQIYKVSIIENKKSLDLLNSGKNFICFKYTRRGKLLEDWQFDILTVNWHDIYWSPNLRQCQTTAIIFQHFCWHMRQSQNLFPCQTNVTCCSFEIPQQYSETDAGNWLQVVCCQEGCSAPHPPLNSACKGESLNTQHQHQSRFQTFDNRCQSSISERISTITFVFLRNGQNIADNWLSARQLTVQAQTELRGAGEEITRHTLKA